MPNYRVFAVCFAALAVSLPMAWISLAKLILLIAASVSLGQDYLAKRSSGLMPQIALTPIVVVILALFGMSTLWTDVESSFAWMAWVKHAKLLEIICISQLIKSRQESILALICLAMGQSLVLVLSYAMAAGLPLPYSAGNADNPIVFAESYIDQGVMSVVFAALVWHLHKDFKLSNALRMAVFALALLNVMALLPGRTGLMTALVVIGLIVFWRVPQRYRLVCFLAAPVLAVGLAYSLSPKVKVGLGKVVSESSAYVQQGQIDSSSGWRLNAWYRSLQAMQDRPWGYGVGSWSPAVKKYQGSNAAKVFGTGNSSNPHQEYLLWGVELGVVGTLLLITLWGSIWRTASRATAAARRATISVLAVAVTACLFNSALYDDLLGDFLCVSLGVLIAYCVNQHPNDDANTAI